MSAPMPSCEPARMLALYMLDVLDTEPDPVFDDIAALAARICAAPIALISLVDTDRQWFKARYGFDLCETPRSFAFSAYALLQEEMLIIPDAREDARFVNHLMVTGEPFVRFYAGVPLRTEEELALGAICVIDRQPRILTEEQKQMLQTLSKHVVDVLMLNRYPAELELFAEKRAQAFAAFQASQKQVAALQRQLAEAIPA